MNGGDKPYTIEINFGDKAPQKTGCAIPPWNERQNSQNKDKDNESAVVINKPPISISISLTENKTERMESALEREKAAQDAKRQEFLRLRDTIFNKNRGPVNNTFLEQARLHADDVPEPAKPVSFLCYWPTYDVMTEEQLKWYICWRELVRYGGYPHVTLSYIFVYIYELINEVGISGAEDGFVRLCALWSAYRELYTALDRYMSSWISDYIAIHFPDGLPEGELAKVTDKEVRRRLPENVIIESLLNGGENTQNAEDILIYILKYSSYNLEKSKFYQTGNRAFIRSYLAGACFCLDGYMKKKTGKGIFASFASGKPNKRMPYQNAIYQGKIKSVDCGKYDYTENKLLKDFIADAVKSVENSLRKLTGYKGKLKTELPPEYAALIDKYVAAKQKSEIIEKRAEAAADIDKSKVKQIIDGADIIRERLLSGVGNDDLPSTSTSTPTPTPTLLPDEAEMETNPEEEIIDSDNALQSDNPYDRLLEALTDAQRGILLYMGENGGEATLADIAKLSGGLFAQNEIDAINEAAIDCLGDILILVEGDALTIQDI